MELTYELGAEVIQKLRPHLDVPINLMDTDGKIVASSDAGRVTQIHSGALKVIESKRELILYPDHVEDFPGTKPGVNLPMYYFGKLVGVVGITGNPDEVFQAANITKAAVEIALEQIHLQRQSAFKENALNNWLLQLFHPYGIDSDKLTQEANHILNIDLVEPVTVAVFHSKASISEQLHQRYKNQLIFLFRLSNDEHVVGLRETDQLEKNTKTLTELFPSVVIGVGKPGYGVAGIRESYLQAKQAIKFANGVGCSHINEWELEQLIDQIPEQTFEEVFSHYGPRLEEMESSYTETLQMYFLSDLQLKDTSERLHIHRNTLMYRLDQIQEKVGLNPRSFKDSMLLYILCFKHDLCKCTKK
ncbi:CdaR family transcriptional regulator [Pseudalkalibacillus berkeleyi]|uniref:Helix-turn-helix domain-containing protein n=1 Tax=Pseudalkalibacillus berkeleyi TaxID=1069813 RepID=A0ABS9GYH5_9BACL|nr:sugar diacid recognition domain-containing protein [Pseudalkalibacillus berkeleyi]MCF6136655.1 helix-turn-helix domain-containing protein [Pseudalkalibacillus berkeleyi]